MRIIHALPFVCLLFLTIPPVWGQSAYFPLATGDVSVFRYADTFNRGDGNLRMKMEVLSELKTIGGKEYFVIENSYGSGDDFSVISTSYMRYAGDGTVMGMEEGNTEEQVFLMKPYHVGTTWDIENMGVAATSTLVDISGSIAGFSGCLVLEVASDETVVRSYFQEGVGLVALSMIMDGKEMLMAYRE